MMERGERAGVSSSSDGGDGVDVVKEMVDVIETVGLYVGYRRTQRKECLNLVRRLKLLVPLLEEIKEIDHHKLSSSEGLKTSLVNLKKALLGAKKLLKKCSCGSKIYLVSICFCFCLLYSCLSRGFCKWFCVSYCCFSSF